MKKFKYTLYFFFLLFSALAIAQIDMPLEPESGDLNQSVITVKELPPIQPAEDEEPACD